MGIHLLTHKLCMTAVIFIKVVLHCFPVSWILFYTEHIKSKFVVYINLIILTVLQVFIKNIVLQDIEYLMTNLKKILFPEETVLWEQPYKKLIAMQSN